LFNSAAGPDEPANFGNETGRIGGRAGKKDLIARYGIKDQNESDNGGDEGTHSEQQDRHRGEPAQHNVGDERQRLAECRCRTRQHGAYLCN
jgi:hypothetical protein